MVVRPCGTALVPAEGNAEFPCARYRLWFTRDEGLLRRAELADPERRLMTITCTDYFGSGRFMTPHSCVVITVALVGLAGNAGAGPLAPTVFRGSAPVDADGTGSGTALIPNVVVKAGVSVCLFPTDTTLGTLHGFLTKDK